MCLKDVCLFLFPVTHVLSQMKGNVFFLHILPSSIDNMFLIFTPGNIQANWRRLLCFLFPCGVRLEDVSVTTWRNEHRHACMQLVIFRWQIDRRCEQHVQITWHDTSQARIRTHTHTHDDAIGHSECMLLEPSECVKEASDDEFFGWVRGHEWEKVKEKKGAYKL